MVSGILPESCYGSEGMTSHPAASGMGATNVSFTIGFVVNCRNRAFTRFELQSGVLSVTRISQQLRYVVAKLPAKFRVRSSGGLRHPTDRRNIMSAAPKLAFVSMSITLILTSSLVLTGQEAKGVPPAPVPLQISIAKKVFIANAPGDTIAPAVGGNYSAYNQFHAAVNGLGQYELVSSPVEADLVFEISFTNSLTGVGGTSSTGCSSSSNPMLRLVIVDPKTLVPLWWFTEPIVQKRMMFHAEKATNAFEDTIPKLVDDLKKIAMPPTAKG